MLENMVDMGMQTCLHWRNLESLYAKNPRKKNNSNCDLGTEFFHVFFRFYTSEL